MGNGGVLSPQPLGRKRGPTTKQALILRCCSTGTTTDQTPATGSRVRAFATASIITVSRLVFHYHRLFCAGFCAQSDWAEFATLFDSRSKDSAEFLILLNPKCSLVGSIKSHAVPFKHDALRDERFVIRTQEPAVTFFCNLAASRPRSCYPLVIILFCE